jgi:hypothetical protein
MWRDLWAVRKQRFFVLVLVFPVVLLIVHVVLSWFGLLKGFLTSKAFTELTFYLAIMGILYGFHTLWEAHRERAVRQTRWEEHRAKMEEIARSMSTRYIGPFPDHLDDIVEVVQRADRDVVMMADCMDYGSFWRPETHTKLHDAVKNAVRKKISVRILVGGEPEAITRSSHLRTSDFDKIYATTEFAHYFDVYAGDPKPNTFEEFRRIMMTHQERFKQELLSVGVEIRTLPQEVACGVNLFLWMEDDQDAVFLFPESSDRTIGLAFRTRDSKLLEIFKATFERYWPSGQPVTNATAVSG